MIGFNLSSSSLPNFGLPDLVLPPALVGFLDSMQWVFFGYFICINVAYLALNYVSVFGVIRYMREHGSQYLLKNFTSYQPPVTIIVPAFNEERTIVSSIRSLLRLGYPEFEVLVVNDGSSDRTLEEVTKAFSLVEFPEAYRKRLATAPVRQSYASPTHPRVRLVDKENGGKADALNAGINCARYPLFCVVDADCILQQDSLARVVQPFLEDATTVAAGGVIRVVNGCQVKDGFLTEVNLPRRLLPLIQTVEYLRGFLFGRLGWSPLNAVLIISGAFGVFYKERVIAIGGYRTDTVGEDMDLVVRLHRQLKLERRPYRITFVPDPICWTEAPEDLRSLRNQRMRWQQGLAESLVPNWKVMFQRNGGAVGWLAFPFMLLFECVGPVIEVLGYVSVLGLWIAGLLSPEAAAVFLFASVGLGVLLSTNALLLEELSFHLYPRPAQQLRLFLVAIFENFGYRQLTSVWRLAGLVRWVVGLRGRGRWGKIRRHAGWQHEPSLVESATAERSPA
jgi:cellulose synthase/poly-beta-1,6-N-acetylglucosamine synthase-like glycosyltransferase